MIPGGEEKEMEATDLVMKVVMAGASEVVDVREVAGEGLVGSKVVYKPTIP